MPNFFSIIIDKSILQGLTAREAEWLFHHFRVNVPPVFFSEILGDLKKEKGFSTGTAIGDVRMLSGKVESAFIDLNAEAHNLVAMELKGYGFPLDGRPILEHAERIRDPRGGFGIYIDQTPMQRVLDRWKAGDFQGMEEAFAKVWRDHLADIDLQKIISATKHFRDKSRNTPAAVMKLVDSMLFKPNQNYANLNLWMEMIGIPPKWRKEVVAEWKKSGRPAASEFVPYTAYMARLEVFFYLAVAHHVITTRPSNRIDMDYFMYLPFTRVFASSDKLHADLFPVFSRDDQVFIPGTELKAGLAEMADFYDQLSEDQKQHGSMTYADYPPVHMDNAVTGAYDRCMPGWREGANLPRPPRDPEADKKVMDHLRPMMDAIKAHNKRMGRA